MIIENLACFWLSKPESTTTFINKAISQTSHTTYPDEGAQLLFYLIQAAFD